MALSGMVLKKAVAVVVVATVGTGGAALALVGSGVAASGIAATSLFVTAATATTALAIEVGQQISSLVGENGTQTSSKMT